MLRYFSNSRYLGSKKAEIQLSIYCKRIWTNSRARL